MWQNLFSKLLLCATFVSLLPSAAAAQAVHQDFKERVQAEVLSVEELYERSITGTSASTTVQELRVEIKGGEKEGEQLSVCHYSKDIIVFDS